MCWGLVRARQLEHVRVGIYGDSHLKQTTSNSADIGARVGTGISAHVKIEGDGVRLQSGHHTKHNERVGGDSARGIELAAWPVWAHTGRGVIGRDRFSWPKWNLKSFSWTRVHGIQLLVERDP